MRAPNPLIRLIFILSFILPGVARAEPLKVGVILALTGPAAANGVAMKSSIELAQKDHPERFTNIQFIFEDAAYEAAQAVAAFNKLKNIDGAKLFYVWGVSFCAPIAPLAEKERLPLVCQGIEQASYNDNLHLIRFMNSTGQYAGKLLSYIRLRKWRTIGIVLTEHPYTVGILESLQRLAGADVTLSIVDRFPTGPVDMRSTVSKLRSSKFDAVGVFLTPGQIGSFYKLLDEQKNAVPTFGTNYFENFDEIKLGGAGMEGAVYVHNEVTPEFVERYQKAFGNQSQLAFAAMAYEFASLVGELFNGNGAALSSDEIIGKLSEVKSRKGLAMGNFQFVATKSGGRYFDFPIAVKKVHAGSYEVIYRGEK